MSQKPLFREKGELRRYFEVIKFRIKNVIESYGNKFLNMDEEEILESLINEYSQHAPVLHDEDKDIYEKKEINILNVRRDPFDPPSVKGILITIAVPFEGNSELFNFSPSSITSYPCGEVMEQEVHLEYQRTEYNKEELKKAIEKDISKIKQWLEWVKRDADQFNSSLEPYIRGVISLRKKKLQKDLDLVSFLGIPIRKHTDVPKTYYVPKIRKKPKIELQKDIEKLSELEPVLNPSDYDDILNTIQSMAITIERNPRAFMDMDEEDLRWILLVPLNAIYEGKASGEIFNYEGKTDILIRDKNKNLFISECKIWRGEKGLLDAIDQLLGYTSWRDTKTAIILFFRGKNFSKILEKIPGVLKSHSCYISETGIKEETIFQFKFHHRDDINRELILSVMAFHVPN